jgi:hypothetical protein
MSKKQAHEEIDRFEKGTLQAFTKLDRATVANDLRLRVNDPFLINQGNKAGICGPATIAFEIIFRWEIDEGKRAGAFFVQTLQIFEYLAENFPGLFVSF